MRLQLPSLVFLHMHIGSTTKHPEAAEIRLLAFPGFKGCLARKRRGGQAVPHLDLSSQTVSNPPRAPLWPRRAPIPALVKHPPCPRDPHPAQQRVPLASATPPLSPPLGQARSSDLRPALATTTTLSALARTTTYTCHLLATRSLDPTL